MSLPETDPNQRTPHLATDPALAAAAVVERARRAAAHWGAIALRQRLAGIRRFRQAAAEAASSLAASASENSGRPLAEVLAAEVLPLLDACRFLERQASGVLRARRCGLRGRPWWLWGVSSVVERQPFGVVMIIAPSNYPVLLPGVQLLQALAAGNAVILKPGVGGTASAELLLALLAQAGLRGIVELLPEAPEVAGAVLDLGVDKLIFTGSAKTGTQVLERTARRAIPSIMELSGCDAAIVRADADLKLAADAMAFGLRLNSGRTCIAPRRVIVARSRATEFEGLLTEALGRCPKLPITPQLSQVLLPLVSEAVNSGAHLLCGQVEREDLSLQGPIALAGMPRESRLLKEDFFAPMLCLLTAADDREAVRLANDCPYALGCSIFTRNPVAAAEMSTQVRAGVVVVNDLIAPTADPRLPFGGAGLSGFGVTRGREGLLELTRPRVTIRNSSRTRFHFQPVEPGDDSLLSSLIGLLHGGGWRNRLAAGHALLQEAARRALKKSKLMWYEQTD